MHLSGQTGIVFSTFRFVCFVCYQTCRHDILKTNEPSLMPISTSGPLDKDMKLSTLGVRRSKVKVTRVKNPFVAKILFGKISQELSNKF